MNRWSWHSFFQGCWTALFVVLLLGMIWYKVWVWRTYYAPLGGSWWAGH